MRILVLHSQVPFASGGAEALVHGLVESLRKRGHEADIVALPYRWNPPQLLLDAALAWRMIDVKSVGGRDVDLVICTKFPTWAVDHPRKVLWLIHQHRQAYDLAGTKWSEFGPDRLSRAIQRHVVEVDRIGIGECVARYAISGNVAKRLQTYTGYEATPLYPPIPLEGLKPISYEPFILSAARLDNLKRIDLLLSAWNQSDTDLDVVIVSDGPERERLEGWVASNGLSARVRFLGRVTDEELVDLYNRCRAVYYGPIDEDYGFAAVEALAAGKAVITTSDSGGVLEFVRDGYSGLVADPNPDDVSRAIYAIADEVTARRLGGNGPDLVAGLNWDIVVQSLTGDGSYV